MKFVFLNGPARSGKDSAVLHASLLPNVEVVKFAAPLYNSIGRIFGLSDAAWADLYDNHKDEPSDRLQGMSPRQALIWLSEDVVKPKFGEDFFGKSMLNVISALDRNATVISTDSGFHSEAKHIIDALGGHNCYHIEIARKGTSFEGDSRGYWMDDRIPTQNRIKYINPCLFDPAQNTNAGDAMKSLADHSRRIDEIIQGIIQRKTHPHQETL